MIQQVQRPILLVVSAPSGAGKTTLCNQLLQEFPKMTRSISCTTRPPRPGETTGRDYHFISETEFQRRAEAGGFLESATVHGHRYGTPRTPVWETLTVGRDVLLAIDVQGAARIRQLIAEDPGSILHQSYVDVFVAPPSIETLQERLQGRGQDSPETIKCRMQNASLEMRHWPQYQYFIVNDQLEEAYARLRAIIIAEHCRVVN